MTAARPRNGSAARAANGREPDLRAALASLESEATALAGLARRQMRERPYTTLGLGLAAGYVLGGGLTPRLAGALVATLGRAAVGGALAAIARSTIIGTEEEET